MTVRYQHHDRGAVSSLMVAVMALGSACMMGLAELSQHVVKQQQATTAAEALASALAAGHDSEAIVSRYDISDYKVERDGSLVIVRVERNGASGEASAVNHRRTLEDGS